MEREQRVIVISTCEECPHYNFDDNWFIHKWGKMWCEKLDKELKSTDFPDDCPLPINFINT